jgi:hypothetical protein
MGVMIARQDRRDRLTWLTLRLKASHTHAAAMAKPPTRTRDFVLARITFQPSGPDRRPVHHDAGVRARLWQPKKARRMW